MTICFLIMSPKAIMVPLGSLHRHHDLFNAEVSEMSQSPVEAGPVTRERRMGVRPAILLIEPAWKPAKCCTGEGCRHETYSSKSLSTILM